MEIIHLVTINLNIENVATKEEKGLDLVIEFSKDELAHNLVAAIDNEVRKSKGEIKYYAMVGRKVLVTGGDNEVEVRDE